MAQRHIRSALATLALACATLTPPATAATFKSESPLSDQGTNPNYRSLITGITPNAAGLSLTVIQGADRLYLINHTRQTVTIYGYQGEPYVRLLADGTVEQNANSPAVYLNQSFYGNVPVPPYASASAPAKWSVIERTGEFNWHDHRIHFLSPVPPPKVQREPGKKQLIFDWTVPIAVGATHGAIYGQLYWVPQSSSTPIAAIIAGVVIVVVGLVVVLLIRRRRDTADGEGTTGQSRPPAGGPAREAW